jgi:hypothetical protein
MLTWSDCEIQLTTIMLDAIMYEADKSDIIIIQ